MKFYWGKKKNHEKRSVHQTVRPILDHTVTTRMSQFMLNSKPGYCTEQGEDLRVNILLCILTFIGIQS
ncbi:hypothetical protein KIN20_024946 [Parelaphostrongylus tenuis]|uniref:Uncharacterized protein n=1 Tax=Parelaphostrongylus tenuis TaxID=148309 RepID=A0AAD5QU01_PARTN|nr:hypothetical protein KIN20_024946 [Parelaphostrongylus tenuis]